MKIIVLINDDCLIAMNKIENKSIDLILCDLPYGTTQCKWDIIIPFEKLWAHYNRIIKDNGAIVLFGTEPFSSHLRLSNLKNYKYDWVWNKVRGTGFLNAKKQPLRTHELISVFYKKQCTYNFQKTTGHKLKTSTAQQKIGCKKAEIYNEYNLTSYSSTERYPTSIQKFSTDSQKSSIHPTQKPVALLEYLIKTYSNEGELILDNCAGSMSTAIACINTNRNYIMIEQSKEMFLKGKKRVEEHLEVKNELLLY